MQVRHSRCVQKITNTSKMQSKANINITLLRSVSTELVLTTTIFDLYIGQHQVVHFLIIQQTVQYALLLLLFLLTRFRSNL